MEIRDGKSEGSEWHRGESGGLASDFGEVENSAVEEAAVLDWFEETDAEDLNGLGDSFVVDCDETLEYLETSVGWSKAGEIGDPETFAEALPEEFFAYFFH